MPHYLFYLPCINDKSVGVIAKLQPYEKKDRECLYRIYILKIATMKIFLTEFEQLEEVISASKHLKTMTII